MTVVLVTGAKGFIGRNLVDHLRRRAGLDLRVFDLGLGEDDFEKNLAEADVIYHLAGVNRPQHPEEFQAGNTDLTRRIATRLEQLGRTPLIVLTSSYQAALDNPYGVSKLQAEEALREFSARTGAPVRIYRLPGVFGKWCRPNYNSVVATFCHNIARDLPISISDPANKVTLVYIDDVVRAFMALMDETPLAGGCQARQVEPTTSTTLGQLAELIGRFREMRCGLVLPDFSDRFTRCLYATYLAYLEKDNFAYQLDIKTDPRGSLAELIKSPQLGQIFFSRTLPGITRGNHYHDTKVEKFCVIEGEAIIRFRHVESDEVIEYPIRGRDYRVVDIPPGYAHSIENVGPGEMIVCFWASEPFDPNTPDTVFSEVLHDKA